jgi:hypothetical protein
VNNSLRRIWKEAVVTLFEVKSQILLERTEENHEKLSQDSRCAGRDSNRTSPEYKPDMFPLELP